MGKQQKHSPGRRSQLAIVSARIDMVNVMINSLNRLQEIESSHGYELHAAVTGQIIAEFEEERQLLRILCDKILAGEAHLL